MIEMSRVSERPPHFSCRPQSFLTSLALHLGCSWRRRDREEIGERIRCGSGSIEQGLSRAQGDNMSGLWIGDQASDSLG